MRVIAFLTWLRRCPARSLQRLLRVHTEIGAGDQHLRIHLHLIIRAGRAKNQPRLARLHQHGRIHGVAHALAGCQRIGVAFFQMPIAHAVIEQDAGLIAGHAGTEAGIDGLDGRNRIAFSVHHAEIGGVGFRHTAHWQLRRLISNSRGMFGRAFR